MKKTLTAVLSFTFLVSTAQAVAVHQPLIRKNFSAGVDQPIKAAVYRPVTAEELVRRSAIKFRIPVDFALRIAKQETGIRCGRIGSHGERGPLQILPASARGLGYKNIRSASCATQTDAGMAHLAMCWRTARGDRRAAARCHNGGAGMTWSKNLSVNRYATAVVGANVIEQGKRRKIIPTSYATPKQKTNFSAQKD